MTDPARSTQVPESRKADTRRWPRRVALALVVAAVAALGITGLAKVRIETGVDSFLPSGDASVQQLQQKARAFGGDPIVVLLESDQPRALLRARQLPTMLRLEGKLAGLPDVASVYGPGSTLNQLAGRAQDLLAELSGRRDAVRAQAVEAAKGEGASSAAAGKAGQAAQQRFDRRYGPLLVQGMPAGLPTLSNDRFVQSVIYTGANVRPQWRFIVPSATTAAILVRPRQDMDAAATGRLADNLRKAVAETKNGAARVTVSGVPVVASAVGDQIAREIPILGGIAVVLIAACFAFIRWTRWRYRLVPLITTLIAIALTLAAFGWAGRPLSLGAAAFLPVLLGLGCYYPTYFAQQARRRMVLVVAAGTIASFATLLLSPLPFVRDLGLTLGLGVAMSAVLGMVLSRRLRAEPATDPEPAAPRRTRPVGKPTKLVFVGASVLAVAGWLALPSLPLQANVAGFAAGLPEMADAKHAEQEIGSSGEVDVLLKGPDVTSPAAIRWMHRAQDLIVAEHGDQARPALSLPSLLGFLDQTASREQIAAGIRLLPDYLTSAVASDDRSSAIMVFGVRMDDISAIRALRDEISRSLPEPPQGYQAQLTGLPMVAARGEELVSSTRILSNVLGVLAATATLAIGLSRRSDAARALLAAALATGLGLFAVWAAGVPLNPITLAIGSLTTAVGCEFTVMLSNATRSNNAGLRRSVLLATATSVLGYLVLAGSELAVVREFGILLAFAVLLAIGSAVCVVRLIAPQPVTGGRADPAFAPHGTGENVARVPVMTKEGRD